MTDNDSTGSDTLCDSEESDNDESSPPSTPPVKTVSFDLPRDETEQPIPELDEQLNHPGCQIQVATSQNDEADERLVHVAWLRKTSNNVYMSNWKSMNLRTYVHAAHRRTETAALLDSEATENFMNLTYAKWLKLPFKCLAQE